MRIAATSTPRKSSEIFNKQLSPASQTRAQAGLIVDAMLEACSNNDDFDALPERVQVTVPRSNLSSFLAIGCSLDENAPDHNDQVQLLYTISKEEFLLLRQLVQLRSQFKSQDDSNQALLEQLHLTEQEVRDRVRQHIDLLHKYNEIKDVTQGMLGKLANIRECTTSSLYPDYNLDKDD